MSSKYQLTDQLTIAAMEWKLTKIEYNFGSFREQ